MAKLTEDQKLFIVQRLAAFRSPQQVADEYKEAYGVEIQRNHVYRYDPTKPKPLGGKKYKIIFDDARKRFLAEVNEIPIAHLAYRLDRHQQLFTKYADRTDRKIEDDEFMLKILEQAAKDCGGMFTNRRELTGKGGESLIPQDPETVAKAVLRRILKETDLSKDEAIQWVADRYKVEKIKLISEANN
jgi:hypothetical protein